MNELEDILEWFACNTDTFIIKDEAERSRTHNTQVSSFAVDERQRLIIDMNLCIFRFIMLPQ